MENIEYFGIRNKFNYDVIQLKVDNVNKTYEKGQFKILHKDNIVTRKEFDKKIEDLKAKGYKEV